MPDPERVLDTIATAKAPTAESTLTPKMLPPLQHGDASVLDRMNLARRTADSAPDDYGALNASLLALSAETDHVTKMFELVNPREPGIADTMDKRQADVDRIARIAEDFGTAFAFKPTRENDAGPSASKIKTSVGAVERALANLLFVMRDKYVKSGRALPSSVHDKFRDAFASAKITLKIDETPVDAGMKPHDEHIVAAIGLHFDLAFANLKLINGGTGAGQQMLEWSPPVLRSAQQIQTLINTLGDADRAKYHKRATDLVTAVESAKPVLVKFGVSGGGELETIAIAISTKTSIKDPK